MRRIRRCGLVEVGVALLKWEGALGLEAKAGPVTLFLLVDHLDVELSAPSSAPRLLVYHHASCHDDNGLNL